MCLNRDNPSKRRAEMAKLLLDHDTKLYVEDTVSFPTLYNTCHVLLTLVTCTQDGRTPLFAASRSGFVDIVKVILEKVAELPQRKQRRALNHTMMVRAPRYTSQYYLVAMAVFYRSITGHCNFIHSYRYVSTPL